MQLVGLGILPPQPFRVASLKATLVTFNSPYFPSSITIFNLFRGWTIISAYNFEDKPVMYNGPPPSPATLSPPCIPPLSSHVASFINSLGKLFFVSHSPPSLSAWELCLVWAAFFNSNALSPSCF
jgi:hypothetical protein